MNHEDVLNAVNQLQAEGETPTIRKVRGIIGAGSFRDIGAALRTLLPDGLHDAEEEGDAMVSPAPAPSEAVEPPPLTLLERQELLIKATYAAEQEYRTEYHKAVDTLQGLARTLEDLPAHPSSINGVDMLAERTAALSTQMLAARTRVRMLERLHAEREAAWKAALEQRESLLRRRQWLADQVVAVRRSFPKLRYEQVQAEIEAATLRRVAQQHIDDAEGAIARLCLELTGLAGQNAIPQEGDRRTVFAR
jgi:Plasmid replication region DNA-binding N-term